MRIIVSGDYCPRERVASEIERGNFSSLFKEVKSVLDDSDYSIVNLECPVVENVAQPIMKCGPNLKCNNKGIEALKWTGFDCVTLANNHFYDYGEEGVEDTLKALMRNELDYVGGGKNIYDASKTLYKEICGYKLAIINCCEHEFSIATESSAGSNPLNVIQQYYAIREAKQTSDYVIVVVHGGVEHFWLPSPRMKETYRFFVDAGADAVINHHQHCYSGYEVFKNKPIIYGVGNYCFDGKRDNERWSTGYIISLNLYENITDFSLIPYKQCYQNEVGVHLLSKEERKVFNERIKKYNSIITDDATNKDEYFQWCQNRENLYKFAINPIYNRYTRLFFDSICGKKIFRKKWVYSKDIIENESHVERLKMTINNMIVK